MRNNRQYCSSKTGYSKTNIFVAAQAGKRFVLFYLADIGIDGNPEFPQFMEGRKSYCDGSHIA